MNPERRHFLKMAGYGLGGTALATMIDRLGLSAALAQQPPVGDYKALVCIFLNGGNDANNMVIPINTTNSHLNYTAYANVRSGNGLAIAQSALSNTMISGTNIPNSTFALHPAFASTTGGNPLYPLWGQSKLAIVANVGPLVQPLTKADYQNPQKSKPYQLFSHSDQQEIWQTAQALRRVPNGWAGRIADNAASQTLPVNTSISGFPVFTKGANSGPLVVNDSRTHLNQLLVISKSANNADDQLRISTLMEFTGIDQGNNYLVDSTSSITGQTISIAANFNVSDPTINTVFPGTTLGYQLLQVARIIKIATTNNLASRQIFFCQLGGFDSHTNELPTHNNLFPQVSQAMRAFYDCTVELGLTNQVTTCTMSDFGRTYQPSGSGGGVGSDHGWGSHQLVLGGAVKGKNFWGVRRADLASDPVATFPILDGSTGTKGLGGNSDTDTGSNPRGRWIPTVAVEQYAATLAKWFGLSSSNMPYVFPNLMNFPVSDLGFMNAG
jgi:uncharacterized protein (DUF1501 family)